MHSMRIWLREHRSPWKENLARLGISADLAVHYVRAGWLTRLKCGVFCRSNDTVEMHPSRLESPLLTGTGCANKYHNNHAYTLTGGQPAVFQSGLPSASRLSTTAPQAAV